MTPEEYQMMLALQTRPKRRSSEDMNAMTRDTGFISGASPFDTLSPFDDDQPFIGKKNFLYKKNPFGL
jgi:hypothetical protein